MMGRTPSSYIDLCNERIRKTLLAQKGRVAGSELTPLILISTGSFSPPHKVHLQNFLVAKEMLKDKYMLVLGLVSPSHDDYVKSKLGKMWGLPYEMRVDMLNDIIAEEHQEDWLIGDAWEGSLEYFLDFPAVFSERCGEVREVAEGIFKKKVEVGFIMGADLLIHCNPLSIMAPTGKVIAVSRPGWSIEKLYNLIKSKHPGYEQLIILEVKGEEFITTDMSSTLIRKYYTDKEYDKVKEFSSPKCLDMLNDYFKTIGKEPSAEHEY